MAYLGVLGVELCPPPHQARIVVFLPGLFVGCLSRTWCSGFHNLQLTRTCCTFSGFSSSVEINKIVPTTSSLRSGVREEWWARRAGNEGSHEASRGEYHQGEAHSTKNKPRARRADMRHERTAKSPSRKKNNKKDLCVKKQSESYHFWANFRSF